MIVFAASSGAASGLASGDDNLPFRQQPIDYFGAAANDPVSKLGARLSTGGETLEFDSRHGYLRALLKVLQVPMESQVLVFSKTSVNARLISPRSPRAVYFNDSVYIGWVPGAKALEISSIDPAKGALFHTLNQQKEPSPRLVREETCLLCHASGNSLNVPGHLLRSYLTDELGNPRSGFPMISHDTPLTKRWGGWYVTGTHGGQQHLGNLTSDDDRVRHQQDPAYGGNLLDLEDRIDVPKYPAPHSDLVALLVLDHQVQLQNLMTRVGFDHRLKRPPGFEDPLLRYLLFADAPALTAPVAGTSGYAAWFEKQGPRDRKGRSLRELDLQTRLFRYGCSPLIGSAAFFGLPDEVKSRIYDRLWRILNGKESETGFSTIPLQDRQALIAILRDTQPNLPDYWYAED